MSFSATQSALEGFRVVGRRPLSFLVWAAATGLVLAAVAAGIWQALGGQPVHLRADWPEPRELLSRLGPILLWALAAFLVLLVLGAIQVCAVYRAVLRPSAPGLAYYRLGGAELGYVVLQLLLFAIVCIAEAVGVLGVGATMASTLTPLVKGLIAMLLVAGLVLLLVVLFVRLALAGPVLVAEGRLDLGRAWSLSRGRFWSLFAMGLLAVLMGAAISMLAQPLLRPLITMGMLQIMPDAMDLSRFGWPDLSSIEPSPWLLMALAGLGIIAVTLQYTVQHAPWAAAYRGLSARED